MLSKTQPSVEALINAWELTRKVLLVAAQVLINDSSRGQLPMAMESSPAATLSRSTTSKLKFTSIKFLVLKLFPLPSVSTLFSGKKPGLKSFGKSALLVPLLRVR